MIRRSRVRVTQGVPVMDNDLPAMQGRLGHTHGATFRQRRMTNRYVRVDGTAVSFDGVRFPSVAALYRAWPGEKPSEGTFLIKLQGWRKRNPHDALTDDVIRSLFQTRGDRHRLTYQGVPYAGPKELHSAYPDQKVGYGAFWARLASYREAHPGCAPDDQTITSLLAPATLCYRGATYRSLAQLHKAIPGDKIVCHRFVDNVRRWRERNPTSVVSDDIIERCIRFFGGDHVRTFGGTTYSNLKALYDDQPAPKCAWGTFSRRAKRLGDLRPLTDVDIDLLLKPQAKVRFFRGILYRWTHLSNGKVYIGISSQTLKERIRLHQRQATAGAFGNPESLQAAIAREGMSAFRVEVLGEFASEDAMKAAEEQAVREHDCLAPKGFNLQEGGRSWTKQGTDVEFDRVTYPSYASLAQAFGIGEKVLDGRRRLGWSLRESLTTPPGAKNLASKPVMIEGVQFKSISEAAQSYGVPVALVYTRLDIGWSLEDAIGLTVRKAKTRKPVVVAGVMFPTITAAAHHYGKNTRAVFWQLDRGKSIEQALGLVP